MKTFLAQNQFLNPSVISPRTEGSAAASKPPPVADAAAAPFIESHANASAEARPTENWGRQAGLSDGEAAIVAPVAEDVSRLAAGRTVAATSEIMDATSRRDEHSIYEPTSSTGGPQEASAPAPTKNPDADALDLTDCISEIFFYARKLMKQPPRFVLDEEAFMAKIEETPLFLREDGYLQRREA